MKVISKCIGPVECVNKLIVFDHRISLSASQSLKLLWSKWSYEFSFDQMNQLNELSQNITTTMRNYIDSKH